MFYLEVKIELKLIIVHLLVHLHFVIFLHDIYHKFLLLENNLNTKNSKRLQLTL